jgi:hypothetical protein
MSKQSKTGVCCFCGRQGVTKQHFWPDWLKKIVPRSGDSHGRDLTGFDLSHQPFVFITPKTTTHQGPFGARKIRKVCGSCNSGWMSKLESDVKQDLAAMICAEIRVLEVAQLKKLAAWAMLISIIGEFTDPTYMAISESDRHHLMTHRVPPELNWKIWVGTYGGKNWDYFYRHHGLLAATKNIMPTDKTCNVQSSAFILGSFYLLTSSSTDTKIQVSFDEKDVADLVQIWPPPATSQRWPHVSALSHVEADRISNLFWNQFVNSLPSEAKLR